MNKLLVLCFLVSFLPLQSQLLIEYEISLKEKTVEGHPGLQSFVSAEYNGEWLLIGGRTDGLHRRQPWAAFLESDNNTVVYVLSPKTGDLWYAPLLKSSADLYEQLQSTNMQFEMRDTVLYVTGGYGFSESNNNHITYPFLTAMNVPSLIASVKSGSLNMASIRYIEDDRMQVTGGYLERLDDSFYLIGGNKFMGRYNPEGPDFGPGFSQEYTNQIRKFKIKDDGIGLIISDYEAITDTALFHRRDYNLVPQIFSENKRGFTVFSGVFQYDANLPWLNTVNVFNDGYEEQQGFEQRFNQYHGANMPFYDKERGSMHTIFFGGIGRYWMDQDGSIIDDTKVPFVKTISMVSRYNDRHLEESILGYMPAYLGASAAFFLNPEIDHDEQEILSVGKNALDGLLVGYIYGGIESTAPNIFLINDGTQSKASNRLFEVWLKREIFGNMVAVGKNELKLFPNPVKKGEAIKLTKLSPGIYTFRITDVRGRIIHSCRSEVYNNQDVMINDIGAIPSGFYQVVAEREDGNITRVKLMIR